MPNGNGCPSMDENERLAPSASTTGCVEPGFHSISSNAWLPSSGRLVAPHFDAAPRRQPAPNTVTDAVGSRQVARSTMLVQLTWITLFDSSLHTRCALAHTRAPCRV